MCNVLLICAVFFGTRTQLIGLTGGIGTGKTTVSNILAQNGFDIIDADTIAKDVINIV